MTSVLVSLVSMLALPLAGPDASPIHGVVRDAAGATVPNAKVEVTCGSTVRRATATGRSKNVVEVTNLNVSFRTATGVIKVVENVSFSVTKGECLAVVGESGSGKSVSALATIGLLSKSQAIVEGSVQFRGEQLLGRILRRPGRGRRRDGG